MTAPPLRIQRQRTKGWRLPPNTVCVSRPSKWGNPFTPCPAIHSVYIKAPALTAADCVALFEQNWRSGLSNGHALRRHRVAMLTELRGFNLACWCRLCPQHDAGKPFDLACENCAPCHGDPLGRMANSDLTCEAING